MEYNHIDLLLNNSFGKKFFRHEKLNILKPFFDNEGKQEGCHLELKEIPLLE